MKIVVKAIVVMHIFDFVVYRNSSVDRIERIKVIFVNLLQNIVHSKMCLLGKNISTTNNNDSNQLNYPTYPMVNKNMYDQIITLIKRDTCKENLRLIKKRFTLVSRKVFSDNDQFLVYMCVCVFEDEICTDFDRNEHFLYQSVSCSLSHYQWQNQNRRTND